MDEVLRSHLARFQELERFLSDPKVLADPRQVRVYARELAQLKPLVKHYREFQKVQDQIQSVQTLLGSAESQVGIKELAQTELVQLRQEEERLQRQIEAFLLGADPEGEKGVILEIRAGTGGSEASLFALALYRMYTRYAARQSWVLESFSATPTEVGGFKEVIFGVEGPGVYRRLKFESGVHRVQRVPQTEASGRIHTSTATVAVLPQAKEVDIQIDPKDLRIDVFRSSGPGGQGVNTTDSAVRVTHGPTGLVVTCQDERSQMKNRAKAMKVLLARLLEIQSKAQADQRSQERRAQIGTGERSEKIRTYNFPDRRVTDHRIGATSHRLEEILDGDLDEFVQLLLEAEWKAKLGKKT